MFHNDTIVYLLNSDFGFSVLYPFHNNNANVTLIVLIIIFCLFNCFVFWFSLSILDPWTPISLMGTCSSCSRKVYHHNPETSRTESTCADEAPRTLLPWVIPISASTDVYDFMNEIANDLSEPELQENPHRMGGQAYKLIMLGRCSTYPLQDDISRRGGGVIYGWDMGVTYGWDMGGLTYG